MSCQKDLYTHGEITLQNIVIINILSQTAIYSSTEMCQTNRKFSELSVFFFHQNFIYNFKNVNFL